MVQAIKLVIATTLATAALASAHPGHHEQRSLVEMAQHRIFQSNARRSLGACAGSTSHRALQERAAARREAQRSELQHQRRLSAADVIAKSHKSNLTDVTPAVDPSTLFGSQPQCILEPEVTQGPYYVTGELIRNDVREEQPGIDLYTELQFIDVNTCEPVADLYVDFWHCNVTGVYAGVNANGNGDSNDLTNINNTFHRGLAPTNSEGIVQFITKFPGHYTGRTTHIHILSNHGGQVLSNNTYAGSSVPSVGQIFFDQDLLTEVSMRRSIAASHRRFQTVWCSSRPSFQASTQDERLIFMCSARQEAAYSRTKRTLVDRSGKWDESSLISRSSLRCMLLRRTLPTRQRSPRTRTIRSSSRKRPLLIQS